MSHRIFTNNPLLAEHIKQQPELQCHKLEWMSTPAIEVLTAAKAAVREGAMLVSNPLSGVRTSHKQAAKPVAFNPYISVLATTSRGALDFNSVKGIDEALAVYRKNAGLRFSGRSDESVMSFQMADMELMLGVLVEIRGQTSDDSDDTHEIDGIEEIDEIDDIEDTEDSIQDCTCDSIQTDS